MSKEDASIYLRAAKVMYNMRDAWVGCCYVISIAEEPHASYADYDTALQKRFSAMFAPDDWINGSYWFNFSEYEQEIRILALCFAAALADADDL